LEAFAPRPAKIAGKDDGKGWKREQQDDFQRVIISHPILPACFAGFQFAAPRGSKMRRFTFRAGEILALMINLICSLMSSADGATCQFFFMGYAMVLYVH
jgi:hypothetical protein